MTPVESTPLESTPVESTPVESTSVESTPVESTPVESTSVESTTAVTLRVNRVDYPVTLHVAQNLLGALRDDVGLTGTKEGCDDCECGACMVLVDGRPVNSCSYLAVQCEGREITTVEGLAEGDKMHALQTNILDAGGVQCGYCTPGMLMSACALLAHNPHPTREEIRLGISGNLCRCTGYARIIDAIHQTAAE